ncbi:metalloprotease [Coemansia sp. RSA 1853]|nr:metalloprotease [Coemansia sp. RSA 1853]
MEGALDRLAAAFINPRFAPECIDREVNAVDSEYKGLQQDDEMYLQQLKKVLTSNKHPYSRFFAGNLQTLKEAAQNLNLSLHEQVAKLYQKYYSADIMNLVVAGNYSMDQLIEWTHA